MNPDAAAATESAEHFSSASGVVDARCLSRRPERPTPFFRTASETAAIRVVDIRQVSVLVVVFFQVGILLRTHVDDYHGYMPGHDSDLLQA